MSSASGGNEIDQKIRAGLERLGYLFFLRQRKVAEEYGLSDLQLIILSRLDRSPISPKQLVSYLGLHKATISRSLKSLKQKRFIDESPDPLDQRRILLSISTKGKRVKKQIEKSHPVFIDLKSSDKVVLYKAIYTLLVQSIQHYHLEQKMCFFCGNYVHVENRPYCSFLKRFLHDADLMIDCPDFRL